MNKNPQKALQFSQWYEASPKNLHLSTQTPKVHLTVQPYAGRYPARESNTKQIDVQPTLIIPVAKFQQAGEERA